jgi:hypothetical protein
MVPQKSTAKSIQESRNTNDAVAAAPYGAFRGVRISLVTSSEIRYVGILDEINPVSATISLTDGTH